MVDGHEYSANVPTPKQMSAALVGLAILSSIARMPALAALGLLTLFGWASTLQSVPEPERIEGIYVVFATIALVVGLGLVVAQFIFAVQRHARRLLGAAIAIAVMDTIALAFLVLAIDSLDQSAVPPFAVLVVVALALQAAIAIWAGRSN